MALLSSALPYTLELLALRRLPTTTFAVLMSLVPAVAALAGYVVLHQQLTPAEGLAIALVIAANIGAVKHAGRHRTTPEAPRRIDHDHGMRDLPDVPYLHGRNKAASYIEE